MTGTRGLAALAAILLTSGAAWAGEPTGFLTVVSDQPAEVQVDGEAAGATPLKHRELPVAEYLVSVKAPKYVPFTKTVQVRKGEDTKVIAVLQPSPGATAAASEWQELKSALKPLGVEAVESAKEPDWVTKGTGATGKGGALVGVGRVDPRLGSRWQDKVFACHVMAWRELQQAIKGSDISMITNFGSRAETDPLTESGKTSSKMSWGEPPFTLGALFKTYEEQNPTKVDDNTRILSISIKLAMPDNTLGFTTFSLYEAETSSQGTTVSEEHAMTPEKPIADAEKLARALQYVATSGVKLKAVSRIDDVYYCLVELAPETADALKKAAH